MNQNPQTRSPSFDSETSDTVVIEFKSEDAGMIEISSQSTSDIQQLTNQKEEEMTQEGGNNEEFALNYSSPSKKAFYQEKKRQNFNYAVKELEESKSLNISINHENITENSYEIKSGTSFFISMVQALLKIQDFADIILSFESIKYVDLLLEEQSQSDILKNKKRACVNLIMALQRILLAKEDQNYDPMEFYQEAIQNYLEYQKALDRQNNSQPKETFTDLIAMLKEGYLLENNKQAKQKVRDFDKIFRGKWEETLSIEEGEYKGKKSEIKLEDFINVTNINKSLSSSLESFAWPNEKIYINSPFGNKVEASKESSIINPSNVLTIFLPQFDKENRINELDNQDLLPKELFLDKFMYQNQQLVEELRKKVKENLQKRNQQKEIEIQKIIKKGNTTKANITDLFEDTVSHLKHLLNEVVEEDFEHGRQQINDAPSEKDVEQTIRILNISLLSLYKKLETFENQCKINLTSKIEISDQLPKEEKYELFGVITCSNNEKSKPYQTFIYDHYHRKWIEVDEKNHLKNVQINKTDGEWYSGTNQENFSLCCLIYKKQHIKTFLTNSYEKSCSLQISDTQQKCKKDIVTKIIEEYLFQINNVIFEAKKFRSCLKKMEYPSLPIIPDFDSFLCLEYSSCFSILKFKILEKIMKKNATSSDQLKQIANQLDNLDPLKTVLEALEMHENDEKLLIKQKKEYHKLLKALWYIKHTLLEIVVKNWKEALVILIFLMEILDQIEQESYKVQFADFGEYLLFLLSLAIIGVIHKHYLNRNTKEALEWSEFLAYCLKNKEIFKREKYWFQIISNFVYELNLLKNQYFSEEDNKRLESLFKFLKKENFVPQENLLLSMNELESQIKRKLDHESYFEDLPTITHKLEEFYQTSKQILEIWVEMEQTLRNISGYLMQNERFEKEESFFRKNQFSKYLA